MRVVVDSSPLIGLSMAGQFLLLRRLFERIDVPGQVYEEVVTLGAGRAGEHELSQARSDGWSTVHPPPPEREYLRGEEAVIELATLLQAGSEEVFVILDDSQARAQAFRAGLHPIGTGGVLLLAKEQGLIDAVRPSLDAMRDSGFRMHPELYQRILARAGEA